MSCKGICHRIQHKRPNTVSSIYANGISYCKTCEVWIKSDELKCPCCNFRLRKKPRSVKAKQSYLNAKNLTTL